MKKEKWIDDKGTTVYETGKRCSKDDLALLKYNAAFNKWISCSDSELKEAETNLNLCRNKYYQN